MLGEDRAGSGHAVEMAETLIALGDLGLELLDPLVLFGRQIALLGSGGIEDAAGIRERLVASLQLALRIFGDFQSSSSYRYPMEPSALDVVAVIPWCPQAGSGGRSGVWLRAMIPSWREPRGARVRGRVWDRRTVHRSSR